MDAVVGDRGKQWSARPVGAGSIRAAAMLLPVGASIMVVYAASKHIAPPTHSLALYLGWWLGISAAATLVLVAIGRLSRRLLPLAALLKLSLCFPDAMPSRLRLAILSGTVKSLEKRVEEARRGVPGETPAAAAERLLLLASSLDAHDELTRGHSERVRAYARLIGRELGLTKDDLERLNWAALLHDIGKLEVSKQILVSENAPSPEEWAALKRHPEFGAALVAPLRAWLGSWCDAVSDHHERWDGGGYPRAISGTEISLAGRIVAVADVYDVITSSRSYKQASTRSEARAEIARCAGTQFDPAVVRAFLAVSLGSARFASGPLSWLSHIGILARTPLVSAGATLSASAVVLGSSISPPSVVGHDGRLDPSAAPTSSPFALIVESAPAPAPSFGSRPVPSASASAAPARREPVLAAGHDASPADDSAAAATITAAPEEAPAAPPSRGGSQQGPSTTPPPTTTPEPPTVSPPIVLPNVPPLPPEVSLPADVQLPSTPALPAPVTDPTGLPAAVAEAGSELPSHLPGGTTSLPLP